MTQVNLNTDWLTALEARFGTVAEIRKIGAEGKPVVHVLYFARIPKRGLMTAVTCGLSNTTHPHWGETKPELVITMNSPNLSWGLGAAWVASQFFDEMRFHHGDLFKLDDPISEESAMNAFLLFNPSFRKAQAPFQLPDRTIQLVGIYPLHADEIGIYRRIGLEQFWKHPDFDTYDPKREPIR